MLSAASLFALLSLAPAALGGDAAGLRYSPPSSAFVCQLPDADWHGFEEEESAGFATHLLGPDNPSGTYRTGIDIRWIEKGEVHWVPLKRYIDDLRHGDTDTERVSTIVKPYRVGGMLARIFEVSERRRLPGDQTPSLDQELHHYYAVIPIGESYYSLKLSSTRDIYLDYRELFVRFLHSFKPLGK